MDIVFLDANVIFSAAYRDNSPLGKLWTFTFSQLITSYYAIEEAIRNLTTPSQKSRLLNLIESMHVVSHEENSSDLPDNITLAEKDKPILLAAIQTQSNYLLTGDKKDFGMYFGQEIKGVLILEPREYFKIVNNYPP